MSSVNLSKNLSFFQAISIAIGAIIGFGCFVLPTDMFLPNAGPLGTIIGVIIGTFFVSIIAISLSVLIPEYPYAGGVFTYVINIFGKKMAFICGWALLIGYISIICVNLAALPIITRFFFPGVFDSVFLYSIFGWNIYLEEFFLIVVVSTIFASINCIGVKIAGIVQLLSVLCLVLGAVVLFLSSVRYPSSSVNNLSPFFNNNSAITSILFILVLAPYLFIGFDTVPQSAEEFSFNPNKALYIMLFSIACGSLLYIIVMLSVALPSPYLNTLQVMQDEARNDGASWGVAYIAELVMGKVGTFFLVLSVLGAVLSGINGFYIASTRLILAMSRANLLPNHFKEIHNKFRTPFNATIFVAALTFITPFAGRTAISWSVEMSSVGSIIGYFFACLSACYLLKNRAKNFKFKICKAGVFLSVICFALLLVPFSPSVISVQAYLFLFLWLCLGVFIFLRMRKEKLL